VCCHCVAADAVGQPYWLVRPPLPRQPFAAFGRGLCKGRYPLANPSGPRSSWFLVYQTQLSIRGQGAVPAPTRSFGSIQTMLLALVTFRLERMGREKRQGREFCNSSRQKCRSYSKFVGRSGLGVGRALIVGVTFLSRSGLLNPPIRR